MCLIYTRSTTATKPFTHVFCTQHGIVARFYPDASCVPYFSPLYVYPENNLFNHTQQTAIKEPNLDAEFVKTLSGTYDISPTPEDIFSYIYAVLHAPTYRLHYAEFLSDDFPRVPFTVSHQLFSQFADYGKRLIAYHFLTSPDINPPLAKFQGTGENVIEKISYQPDSQYVSINSQQYFAPLSSDVWNYEIAGYQVCSKWLRDRKDRKLRFEEIKHYCQIITALHKTIHLQSEIDVLYPDIESGGVV